MVENLIADYLSTGKRLVIPDLGAFLKKDTGETVFVEFLKKDDGVFTELISRSLAIPARDAALHAARFSGQVKESLAGKGFFIVPRVGTMRRDASGNITITATSAGENTSPQNPVTPVVTAQPDTMVPQATIQQPPKVEATAPAASSPEPAPVKPQVIRTEPAEPVRPRVIPQGAPSVRPVQKSQDAARSYEVRRSAVNIPQNRKRTDLVMIIAIVAALVAIGSMVFGLLVNSDPIGNIQPTSPRQEQTLPAVDDRPAAEEAEGAAE